MRQRVFGHMRTAKAQISLRIRAVWSGPSLSANRIIGYYRMYQWRANARMRPHACVGWIWLCAFCACWKRHVRSAQTKFYLSDDLAKTRNGFLRAEVQQLLQQGAISEDSDQPAHPRSLIRVFAVRRMKLWVYIIIEHSEDSDQSVWMRKLIWVFAERTCIFVENDVPRYIGWNVVKYNLTGRGLNQSKWY